jgi:hypothetical protein
MCIPEAKLVTVGTNITAQNEPWLLGKHVTQCFIITDPTKPSHVVVMRGKRNIIEMDVVANEEDFDQYGDPMKDNDEDNTTYTINGKSTFRGTKRKSASVSQGPRACPVWPRSDKLYHGQGPIYLILT